MNGGDSACTPVLPTKQTINKSVAVRFSIIKQPDAGAPQTCRSNPIYPLRPYSDQCKDEPRSRLRITDSRHLLLIRVTEFARFLSDVATTSFDWILQGIHSACQSLIESNIIRLGALAKVLNVNSLRPCIETCAFLTNCPSPFTEIQQPPG